MFAYCNNNPVNLVDKAGTESAVLDWLTSLLPWLPLIDGVLPIGDALCTLGGIIVLISALFDDNEYATPQISYEEEKKESEPDPPDVTYPGDDPTKAPDGTTWKGKGEAGSKEGNYYNPKTGESWHPDLDHPEPIGPHWDYRDSSGIWWRIAKNKKPTLK